MVRTYSGRSQPPIQFSPDRERALSEGLLRLCESYLWLSVCSVEIRLKLTRMRDGFSTLATVWRRAFLDAIVAPEKFRVALPAFRRVSDMMFHSGIRNLHPSEIPTDGQAIQLLPSGWGPGDMPIADLYALLRVARWIQPKKIFEFGTYRGMTTSNLAVNVDAEILTLDLSRELAGELTAYSSSEKELVMPASEIGSAYRYVNRHEKIRQLFGDSRSFHYQPFHKTMDLVLIDACHMYDYVMADSQSAFKLLGERGAILWHDFGNLLDVNRAVKHLSRKYPIFHLEGTWLALYLRGVSVDGLSNDNSPGPGTA
jgi:hypothetical protein